MMVLTLISQIAVLDTAITITIDSGALVPPTYTVWIRVKNNGSTPVDVYIERAGIPYGKYIADTFNFGGATMSVSGCLNIPYNYALKNQNFNSISVCTHGWTAFLKSGDPIPSNIPGGYNAYHYWVNFLDDGSTSALDTLKLTLSTNRIDIYGIRIGNNEVYRSRLYTQFYDYNGQTRVKEIGLTLDPGDTGLITAIHMLGSPFYRLGGSVNLWDDEELLIQLFNFETGANIVIYKELDIIDTAVAVSGVKTIPPGGTDSFPVVVNMLKLKQNTPQKTYYGRYTGGFFLYKVGDNNPVGQSNIYVNQDGQYTVSFSENKGIVSNKPPFIYQNGKLILTEKGIYRIYSVDGSILGYVNSNGNYNIRHLKPGVYIINYEGKSYRADRKSVV